MNDWNHQPPVNGEARQGVAVLGQAVADCQKRCDIYRGKVDSMEKQLWTLRVWGSILVFLAGVIAGPVVTAVLIRMVLK